MNDILKFVIGTIIILSIGIVLAIIGIQHEHLTKLRDEKAELEIMLKDSEKKIEELETELSKYNKKRGKRKNE